MVGKVFKVKGIKEVINNKKGNAGIILILTIVILMAIDLAFGIMEISLNVMALNEVKDIIRNVAPHAVRKGINVNAHKNEVLEEGDGYYDKNVAKEYFVEQVSKSIDKMNFRSKIKTPTSQIKDDLRNYTEFKKGNGQWANTWSELDGEGNKKSVDYVIVSTVLRLELENNHAERAVREVNKVFNVSTDTGEQKEVSVNLTVSENGLAAFLKVEMKVVLT